jgi:hypothetical protein
VYDPEAAARLLELRKPLDDLELRVIRRHLQRPGALAPPVLDGLRYVLSFARLTTVRAANGQDVEVADLLSPWRWRVQGVLHAALDGPDPSLWEAARRLPGLLHEARGWRARLLSHTPLDRDSFEAEVTTRQLVVAAGGGGGSGYGYAGAFRSLHRAGLQPALLAGTSIGSILSTFRARHRVYDGAKPLAAARALSWQTVFRVLEMESRYGIPASLRLYLRTALGGLFEMEGGRQATFHDMEIPLLIAVTGVTMDGLRHDLGYYEHYLDDTVRPGVIFRASRIKRVTALFSLWKEFLSTPGALREVVFGADPLTMQVDVLDAAGFSSAVTGVIHYDVLRDDPRTRHLLDQLYGEHGISRLTEGGLVNNLPARPAWAEVMRGRLGRRNPFVLALDCFAPGRGNLAWIPIQQIVRPNVRENERYANLVFQLQRRLSPVNLVPSEADVLRAMDWTSEELDPHVPIIQEACRPLAVLPEAGHGPHELQGLDLSQ